MLLNLSKSTLSRICGVLETAENPLIQKKPIKPSVPSTRGLRFIHARIVRLSSASLSALVFCASSPSFNSYFTEFGTNLETNLISLETIQKNRKIFVFPLGNL